MEVSLLPKKLFFSEFLFGESVIMKIRQLTKSGEPCMSNRAKRDT